MKISITGLFMMFILFIGQFLFGISGELPLSVAYMAMMNGMCLLIVLFMDPVNNKDESAEEEEP